jgi:hypothetical protein
MPDRRVHASHPEGEQVVRYNRQGKWYIELVQPSPHAPLRKQVPIAEAVTRAKQLAEQGGEIHYGLYGGSRFDKLVARR